MEKGNESPLPPLRKGEFGYVEKEGFRIRLGFVEFKDWSPIQGPKPVLSLSKYRNSYFVNKFFLRSVR